MHSPERRGHGHHEEAPDTAERANDNVPLEHANDNSAHEALRERAKRNRAFEQTLKLAEHSKRPGEVIFMGGVTASYDPEKLTQLKARENDRHQFGEQFRSMHTDSIVVITREEIAQYGSDLKHATIEAIHHAKADPENHDKTIVVETPLFLDKVITKPWEQNSAALSEMTSKHGGKEALKKWLEKIAVHDAEEEVHPTMEELEEIFEHSKEDMKHFIEHELHGPFSMALALNPASLMFLIFLKKGHIDRKVLRDIARDVPDWDNSICSVRFLDYGTVEVTVNGHPIL